MEALYLFAGIVGGVALTYELMSKRIEDYKLFSEIRIDDYKDAFSKGYETKNGIAPFTEETTQNEPVSTYFDESEEAQGIYKPERWDD